MSGRGAPGTWEYLVHWSGSGAVDLDATLADLPFHDHQAGMILNAEWNGGLIYEHGAGGFGWYAWNGRCHGADAAGVVDAVVTDFGARTRIALERCKQALRAQVAADMPGRPEAEMDKETENRWLKWQPAAKYAHGLARNAGATALASYMAKILGVPHERLAERNPRWLNNRGGTTDLEKDMTRQHDPADMLTYCVPVAYRPEMQHRCPRFLDLVHRMAGRNDQVANYVLRVLGYSMIGANPEQVIFFLNGPTKSGKSQVLYIVRQILGELAIESPADLITYARHGRNARVENSIRGRRLITISETSARMHIEESQLKRLTGEPVIAIDQHYEKSRLRTPVTWLIIVATNDMPGVAQMDNSMRERMIVIPCGATIPVEQRDKGLAERILAEESEGILATLVYFAGLYFQQGLKPPPDVEAATEYYCQRQNLAAQFADDLLNTGLGWDKVIPGHQLWKACQDWGKELSMPGRNSFYEMLSGVPGVQRDTGTGRQPIFRGVAWKQEAPARYWM